MRIDCATCPARNRACDGCLMQVLFAPLARDYGPDDEWGTADFEIADAVDVLVATDLITETAGRRAKSDIAAVHTGFPEGRRGYLRAV
ncbi:hypothetical protein [Gordonia alkaliphila]|uniref:Uncharacterized protein n=1 Tax=Gordonia alkaliphila TaxID=1053547 RepID=A0ABP8Z557_9ACTN